MRTVLKRVGERFLAASPLPGMSLRGKRGRSIVLAYHDVCADSEAGQGDRSLHLKRSDFAEQLDYLVRHFDVVPVDNALREARSSRPRVAITFDDAYRGALTHGVAELRTRTLPATVFVAPDLIGDVSPWWDQVEGSASGLPDAFRATALTECRGFSKEVLAAAAGEGLTVAPLRHELRIATEAELASAVANGLDVGVHTWSHPNMQLLTDDELSGECRRAFDWLSSRYAGTRKWISYPYGLFDRRVAAACQQTGFEFGFAVSGGWTRTPPADPFAIPRVNIPAGISLAGFALRVTGAAEWLGSKF